MDYVDVDAMQDSKLFQINGVKDQRSPVTYSEETTSSGTNANPTSPIQSIAAPPVDWKLSTEDDSRSKTINHRNLILQNKEAIGIDQNTTTEHAGRKPSRSNGRNLSRDEVVNIQTIRLNSVSVQATSPSVTFKIPSKETTPMKRLSSATDVLESTRLLKEPSPPIPNSQSSNSVAGKQHSFFIFHDFHSSVLEASSS